MKALPDRSVDMVLCDLPYGTTQNKWDSVIPFTPLFAEYRRLLKPDSSLVLTGSQPFTSALIMAAPDMFRVEWVWRKSCPTGHLNVKRIPMKEHENVIVLSNGTCPYFPQGLKPYGKIKRRGNNGTNYGKSGTENFQEVTGYPRSILEVDSDRSKQHPTQKPVALFSYLIRTYTNPGAVVLDNCCGSGTTGVACIETGRSSIQFELSPEYFTIAERRLDEAIAKREQELAARV